MSSQKPTAVELTTEAGEGEGEARALSSSQLDKQEYVSFPRPSRAAGQTSVAKKSGQQAPPSLKTLQRQLDWQVKLEYLQNLHKQESMQQKKEHLEQLRQLQAQILSELTVKSPCQTSSDPTPSIAIHEVPQPQSPVSPNSRQSLSSSPVPVIYKGGAASEPRIGGLTRTHSSSDPQLTIATHSPKHPSASPSPIKANSTNCTPLSSPQTKPSSHSPLRCEANTSPMQQYGSNTPPFSVRPSYGFLQATPPSTGSALVRISTTESLEQVTHNSVATSVEASPIKADEHSQTKGVESRDQSPLNISQMSPNSTEGAMAGSMAPGQRKIAWTEASSWQNHPSCEASLSPPTVKNISIKTSPASQSLLGPTPNYPTMQLSPRYASQHGGSLFRSLENTTSVQMTTPSSLGRGGGGNASINTTINESQSRALLMEKHHRHMEDLKEYYELELSQLHSRVEKLEVERNNNLSGTARRSISPLSPSFVSSQNSPQRPTTPRQPVRQLYFPSSLVKSRAKTPTNSGGAGDSSLSGVEVISPTPAVTAVVNESEMWMLQNENARLKGECSDLRSQVDLGQREKHALEEQVKRLHEHTLDWKERLEASERMVSVLQERLETTRSQLYDQDKLVGQLRSDLQVDAEELHYWKEQRGQDMEKLEQLFDEFKVLQQENEDVRSVNSELQYQLEEAHKKTITYKTSVDKYQVLESQYKSTIHELEDEVRHLQHVNNRLHSMGTHYQLGGFGSPFNQRDEEKFHVSPRSSTRSGRTPSTPQMSHAQERRETPASSVTKVPLTRRKWLESSVPGLIFGSGGEGVAIDQPTTDENPPMRTQASVTVTPSRMPAIVSLASGEKDGGGNSPQKHQTSTPPIRSGDQSTLSEKQSAQGEDPTNYGYDQTWYHGGHEDDRLRLAESALKAIRDGSVLATNEGVYPNQESRKKRSSKSKTSVEERVMKHMQIVTEAEQKLIALQKEKEKLESSLLKTPRVGSRTTRQTKQSKLDAEKRLEEVMKEIGSVRMVLRRHHALKK